MFERAEEFARALTGSTRAGVLVAQAAIGSWVSETHVKKVYVICRPA